MFWWDVISCSYPWLFQARSGESTFGSLVTLRLSAVVGVNDEYNVNYGWISWQALDGITKFAQDLGQLWHIELTVIEAEYEGTASRGEDTYESYGTTFENCLREFMEMTGLSSLKVSCAWNVVEHLSGYGEQLPIVCLNLTGYGVSLQMLSSCTDQYVCAEACLAVLNMAFVYHSHETFKWCLYIKKVTVKSNFSILLNFQSLKWIDGMNYMNHKCHNKHSLQIVFISCKCKRPQIIWTTHLSHERLDLQSSQLHSSKLNVQFVFN